MAAMTQPKGKPYTAKDLEQLDAQGFRYELIGGVLREISPTGPTHGNTTGRASYFVSEFVYKNELGETFIAEVGFVLSRNPDTVLAPDFAFIRESRLPSQFPEGYCEIMPDLVIETRSPGDTQREVMEKTQLWLSAGVPLVWNIDPKSQTVTVHQPNQSIETLGINDTLTGGDILPGFILLVKQIFRS
jgi:Uma2 family endonuclease